MRNPHFFDQTPDTLADLLAGWGMPRFRAKQVLDWVYRKGVADPQAMTNLSQRDRDTLAQNMTFLTGRVIRQQTATDTTQKLLIDWSLPPEAPQKPTDSIRGPRTDDCSLNALTVLNPTQGSSETQTECVLIPSTSRDSGKARRTACVSSQVGCPVGCKFCASGLGGLDANLTAGQIVQQAWQLSQLGITSGVGPLTNVVFMGMGEPLVNLKAVLPALHTLAAPWGMNLSARRITVSTVGVPAGIKRLAALDLPVTLAISLHAPNDELRKQIIPWAEGVTIDQLVDAGQHYFRTTKREITLEYILLGGLNDQPQHAHELAAVSKRLRSNINLIRYNEVAGLAYARPDADDVHRFQHILQSAGRTTHIRASRGRDIAAACGQLRHETATPTPATL
ncbi:MAG: 23S rRNA (adenine(2503)-C(2))-methyltransferase RlmN [Planctomycetota bacterium]